MSSQVFETPRQGLNPRQAETVERLLVAGLDELRAVGHEALTVRTVAQRAGVSPATAYTYLASKNHLFAELFWRHLATASAPPAGATPAERLKQAVRDLTDRIVAEPKLAAAVTPALLGSDPDVARLRLQIGTAFLHRFAAALADPADPEAPRHDDVLDVFVLAFSGALLQAGMGLMTYEEIAERLTAAVDVLMRGR
ncbi:TetR/AcrR family transcriptional regulator [Nocardioides sp. zg-536]|uniref:TetR/AcrR family transcriptional regulator n=1 Tax=Nocardioides faecalis TaxID=2803858 RepID=A0A939BZB8_9ACTN|nr:TetR/AcrR family transcriptional regulator [Nocardioides faecalis]MBM9460885.1 TetR/AcrR family transcriptional regulator [Nocardioides faecalis]MBS4751860.1 TetR/AcrR family transcriptional regulator [Nocardioides faecalis]QVI59287.1 TetR/AcrR family transcriptional regulator [Nocardioides faecalis]